MPISKRIDIARKAFDKKDLEKTKIAHTKKAIASSVHKHHADETHGGGGKYLGDFVYGSIDGIVTTFAVVSGVTGASLSVNIILILGFANLIADGLSMAVGNFLSIKAGREFVEKERKREEWEIENYPKGEIEEIREIFKKKGFSGKALESAVKIITSNKKIWIDTMMKEELELISDNKSAVKGALATYAAFVSLGLIPLLAYILSYFIPFFNQNTFLIAIVATLLTLFLVGVLKIYITKLSWLRSGMETMLIGGLAATASYGIGYFVSLLV